MMPKDKECVYISVDVETSGPEACSYSLLSIGACLVQDPDVSFYAELQPVGNAAVPQALRISQLSLEELRQKGLPPAEAMRRFAEWMKKVVPRGCLPILVAFNAPFDWMFVDTYFHRYLNHNPFGHSALDMKAFYMGFTGVEWVQTGMGAASSHFGRRIELSHHALRDAQEQAVLFQKMLHAAQSQRKGFHTRTSHGRDSHGEKGNADPGGGSEAHS
jgi:ribonuclease T